MVNPSAVVSSSNNSPQSISLLQIGNQTLNFEDLLACLRRYGLMPTVVKEIVVDQAIAQISLSDEEQAGAVDNFKQNHQLRSDEQCQTFLTQRGLTPADLPHQALREQKLQKFKAETWGAKVESHFLQRKNRLDRVLYSLIRTREAGLAQELYFRIQDDGQPFADLARQYSDGQEAQTGGLIGPVELSVPHPALARILSISKPGQVWPPNRIGDWYIIVRLEKFLPAKLDDSTRQRLLDELYNGWLVEQVQAVMTTLGPDQDGATLSTGSWLGGPAPGASEPDTLGVAAPGNTDGPPAEAPAPADWPPDLTANDDER